MSPGPGAVPPAPGPSPAGHHLTDQGGRWVIDAWGPDQVTCLAEATTALVERLGGWADTPATDVVPLAAGPGESVDALQSLLQQVIDTVTVLSLHPLRVHLAATEDDGVAGDMDVAPHHGTRHGPLPQRVSAHGLTVEQRDGEWRCHAVVDT